MKKVKLDEWGFGVKLITSIAQKEKLEEARQIALDAMYCKGIKISDVAEVLLAENKRTIKKVLKRYGK